MENLLQAFGNILNLTTILLIVFGCAFGIIFASIPGLTVTMAIGVMVPVTFKMLPDNGLAMLIGIYMGGLSGGLISAILLNMPGTPGAIGTTFDGYPMAQKGLGAKALGVGTVASFIGGIISAVLLVLIAIPLASIAIKFGPWEYFAICLFALTIISTLTRGSLLTGLISCTLGLIFSTVGPAPIDGMPRFHFGWGQLAGGFQLLPVMIGMFALSQVFEDFANIGKKFEVLQTSFKDFLPSGKELKSQSVNIVRSTLIGTGIGILPGVGSAISNIAAYARAKAASKYPEKFGTGIIDGVVATETANNATTGGALIPLMCLGIPGDIPTAMLLSGLMIHGIQPGPLMFTEYPIVVYGIFVSVFLANIIMFLMMISCMRGFTKVLSVPRFLLQPLILTLCVVGSYALNNRLFDVWTLLFFGALGFGMRKVGLPLPPFLLGIVLEPILEMNLRSGLASSDGSLAPLFTNPIACGFLLVTLASVASNIYRNQKKRRLTS